MARVVGLVDALVGRYLSGWALDHDVPEHACLVTVSTAEGELVAKARASRTRPDLEALGLGRVNFAFRILLPPLVDARRFFIEADGVPLPNSPFEVGPGLFDGDASVGGGVVAGWVTERLTDAEAPSIRAIDQDGAVLVEALAGFDGAGVDPNFRAARFSLELPGWAFRGKSLHITVSANGTPFARCTTALSLDGFLDVLTPTRCAGWLLSPEAPRQQFTIVVYRDGVPVGTGRCCIPRPDLAAKYADAGAAGFDFALDVSDRPAAWQQVSLRLEGGTSELFDGPFYGRSRAGAVGLIRAAAGALLDTQTQPAGAGAVLRRDIAESLERARSQSGFELVRAARSQPRRLAGIALTIIIPVYRGLEVTRICLQSVLSVRDPQRHRVIVVNDNSPEPGMASLLGYFATQPNVIVEHNAENAGFIRSINRGLGFCLGGDVLLLNSDTRLFPGCLDEMLAVLHARASVGTVTALSNNATIFSYPHAALRGPALPDAEWDSLAAVALEQNRGLAIDVPTGHGFCLLIRDEVLQQVGAFDEAFGRGYGEENDFCQRAADLGYRHVAAGGVLVEHRESVSFTDEKEALLRHNLQILEQRYPEYTPTIMAFEQADPLRVARWPLDRYRLRQASTSFLLVIQSWFGGGSGKAADETLEFFLQPGQLPIYLRAAEDGGITLEIAQPVIRAVFQADEAGPLFDMLDAANPSGVVVHQMLGFGVRVLQALARWLGGRRSIIYLHDFYTACPRVTLIDSLGYFCGMAPVDRCTRCLELGAAHEHSRLGKLAPSEHRALFHEVLAAGTSIVTPSTDTAKWLARSFPSLDILTVGHAAKNQPDAAPRLRGKRNNILLLGAIGPHKGADQLVELARHARLDRPDIVFKIIGYTSREDDLLRIGNVEITGKYNASQLPSLIAAADGCAALFLHGWPETFSYTLSEAATFGLMPIVPDIGAPAERVRQAGFGLIFPFPFSPRDVLDTLARYVDGEVDGGAGEPADLIPDRGPLERLASTTFGQVEDQGVEPGSDFVW